MRAAGTLQVLSDFWKSLGDDDVDDGVGEALADVAFGVDFLVPVVDVGWDGGGRVTSTAGGSGFGVSVIRTRTDFRPLPDPTEDRDEDDEAADRALVAFIFEHLLVGNFRPWSMSQNVTDRERKQD